jgi:hypothetical protein
MAGDAGADDAGADDDNGRLHAAVALGVTWLIHATDRGRNFPPSPIGLYFAKLWYFEKLYPLIYTVAALSTVEKSYRRDSTEVSSRPGATIEKCQPAADSRPPNRRDDGALRGATP